jgi:DNA-directed RNA polymerase I subunit RPA1
MATKNEHPIHLEQGCSTHVRNVSHVRSRIPKSTNRSVISPDPFMDTDQVGIPEVFAKRLSFPEAVNDYNVKRLRQAVLNGPNVWPGANYIVDEKGNK